MKRRDFLNLCFGATTERDFAHKELEVSMKQYIESTFENDLYVPSPNLFEDHEIHLQEHKKWFLNDYYKCMAREDTKSIVFCDIMVLHLIIHAEMLCKQRGYKEGNVKIQIGDMIISRETIKNKQTTTIPHCDRVRERLLHFLGWK